MINFVRTVGIVLWCLGLCAAIYLMFQLSVPYVSFDKHVDFLNTKQNVYHIAYWRYSFYAHVFTSILVLPAGFTQFNSVFFKKGWHRKLGMIYLLTVLFISAPTGFLMGLHANGGLAAKASFVLLSSLWFITTLLAIVTAKRRKFIDHGEWMLYSYALTLSAITFRLIALGFDLFGVHVPPREVYVTTAWLSWVPNIIIAHLMIKMGFIKRLFKRYLTTAAPLQTSPTHQSHIDVLQPVND
ncbi:MAG: DUF2306 domain-containing protein [Chitinophagaceae bacterium]|nr:MAG: DUF2306 domain-containing protein [Chitinophagaceae bacterium]